MTRTDVIKALQARLAEVQHVLPPAWHRQAILAAYDAAVASLRAARCAACLRSSCAALGLAGPDCLGIERHAIGARTTAQDAERTQQGIWSGTLDAAKCSTLRLLVPRSLRPQLRMRLVQFRSSAH